MPAPATDASFEPPIVLRGPHAQTILSSRGPRRARIVSETVSLAKATHTQIADCGDGVRLLVEFTPGSRAASVALFHGWEGHASSTYMLATAQALWSRGYSVYRINLRDHGPSHHLNVGLFHSCRLAEAIGAVRWVRQQQPNDELSLGGFSLGGNFCLRIASTADAESLRLHRVFAVCPVIDPASTMISLDSGSLIYRRYFLRKWRRSLETKQAAFPDRYDFGVLTRFDRLEAMTEYFVDRYTDYSDLHTYLNGYAITGDRLSGLTARTHVVFAADDPIIPVADVNRLSASCQLTVEIQRYGGHCGFLTDLRFRSWINQWVRRALAAGDRRAA